MPCASAATRCGAFPVLSFAPRTVLPSIAITSRPLACAALVCSQAPRTRSSTSGLTRANARRNVDSSAGPRPRPARPAPPRRRRRPTARSRRTTVDPAITAAIPTASRPPGGACGRASCAGPGPGQGDRGGTGCGQPEWAKMASAGGRPSWQTTVSVRTSIVPPGPARHPQARRTLHPLLRHRRPQPHFTTLPCPWQPGTPGSMSSSSVGRATHRHGGMSRCWPPEQGCSPSPRPGGGPGCP